ncbi:MAG TPA: hypothetical protein VNJ01_15630 [Bacteriovoracaceae bacterium]|nr:hypothetical protein [Bacteriovoracaceae bacterium]
MKKDKKNLKDLVAATNAKHTQNDSPYANLRYKLTPKKLQEYIEALSETKKDEFLDYCDSPSGKREQRVFEAGERRATRERATIRKNRIFNERFSKLILNVDKTEQLRERLNQAKTLTLDEIALSLTIFPELLPDGHKSPALTLARKHLKAILSDKEKEYLMYVWAATSIPADICYTRSSDQRELRSSRVMEL